MTGTVTDASTGETIVGASVVLKGSTTQWAMTDDLGQYSLTVPSNGVLEVSFMGYTTLEVPVNGRTTVDVQLEMDAQMLDDVIVVGYGTARKITSVVGSASTVKNEVLMNRPSANVGDALQGQVAGLQIFSQSGEPMGDISMRLRGVNSINAGTTPLFILDGSPVSSDVFNSLNSNDIENIVVLKDASSTAIYGSRAANGVIYITTKKGRAGEKPVVKLSGQYGISTIVNHKMTLMNSDQWFQFQTLANPNWTPTAQQQEAIDMDINTNWLDFFFNEAAPVWSADLSVSGASDKTDYYFSFGAFSQTGTAPFSDLGRYSLRTNINTKATNWLKLGVNLGMSYQDYQTAGFSTTGNSWYNPTTASNWMLPWVTPYVINRDDPDNPYVDYSQTADFFEQVGMYNTIYLQEMQPSNYTRVNLNINTYEEITPVKGLTLKAQQGLEAYDYTYDYASNPDPEGPFPLAGSHNKTFRRYYQFTFTNTAEYRFAIAEKNHFSILAGQEAIFDKYESTGMSVDGITDWRLNLISQGTTPNMPSSSITESVFNSYFARLSYDFNEKYFLDASWRLDGSSYFGENNKYANFWSVGAMWDIKKEDWMQGAGWINDLRLSASYGTTGNSSLPGAYLSLGTIGTFGTRYDGLTGWGASQAGNPDLTWETVASLNIGVTARLWNFLDFTVEYYDKKTSDMLMQIPYSLTTGYEYGWGNVGSMINRGVDVDVNFDIVNTNDIYFAIGANFNYNYNEITELFGGRDQFTESGTGISYQVGMPYGEFFYVRSAGVDPADGMQMWYDLDGNKTKQFSDEYAVFTGKQRYAPWTGGINLSFQYKGLYIGADFSWVAGKWTVNNDRYFLTNPIFTTDNMNGVVDLLDMWTTPGQVTDIPGYNSPRQFDDTLLENASFFRLKNLQISYDFPQKWMDRTGFIKGFRVYAIGRNLLTFTQYSGYDPERDTNLQMGIYPNSRQFTIGAEFTF